MRSHVTESQRELVTRILNPITVLCGMAALALLVFVIGWELDTPQRILVRASTHAVLVVFVVQEIIRLIIQSDRRQFLRSRFLEVTLAAMAGIELLFGGAILSWLGERAPELPASTITVLYLAGTQLTLVLLIGLRSLRSNSLQRRVTPEMLLGLLDRAKSFRIVAQQYPEAVQQIEHAAPGDVTLYKDFKVSVDEVFRFDPEDTLVFKLKLENTGESEVIYQPQRLATRIGEHVYHASIADASGIIPPKATTTGYFAITGTPNGGRANLSIKNRFNIIVPRVERDAHLIVPE